MAGIMLTVSPDSRSLREVRERLAGLARLGRSPRRSLQRTGLFIRRDAQRLLRARARDWGNAGGGRLGKSLAIALDSMSVTVGSNLVYAAIQQLGGTVSPKEGRKYLAIPVLGELRRAGTYPRDLPRESMRFTPAARIDIGSHSWVGPALLRTEDVVNANGRPVKRAGQVMFALIRRATIKGRPYLVFEAAGQRFLLAELQRDAADAWRRGGRT